MSLSEDALLHECRPEVSSVLDSDFWARADVNDVVSAILEHVPRGTWIEASGDPDGLCYVEWMCLCALLNVSFSRLEALLAPNWGQYLTIPGMERSRKQLSRKGSAVRQPLFWRLAPGVNMLDFYYNPREGPGKSAWSACYLTSDWRSDLELSMPPDDQFPPGDVLRVGDYHALDAETKMGEAAAFVESGRDVHKWLSTRADRGGVLSKATKTAAIVTILQCPALAVKGGSVLRRVARRSDVMDGRVDGRRLVTWIQKSPRHQMQQHCGSAGVEVLPPWLRLAVLTWARCAEGVGVGVAPVPSGGVVQASSRESRRLLRCLRLPRLLGLLTSRSDFWTARPRSLPWRTLRQQWTGRCQPPLIYNNICMEGLLEVFVRGGYTKSRGERGLGFGLLSSPSLSRCNKRQVNKNRH
jgi:hypothetical protein